MTRNSWIAIPVAIVVGAAAVAWWAIPTYKQAEADKLVNELCAKDGGTKVYETVALPPEKFDRYGNVDLPASPKGNAEFFLKVESVGVEPYIYSQEGKLSIARESYKVFRKADGKLLGESISYLRRGGDPSGPGHPTSYRCPRHTELSKKVFVKK